MSDDTDGQSVKAVAESTAGATKIIKPVRIWMPNRLYTKKVIKTAFKVGTNEVLSLRPISSMDNPS